MGLISDRKNAWESAPDYPYQPLWTLDDAELSWVESRFDPETDAPGCTPERLRGEDWYLPEMDTVTGGPSTAVPSCADRIAPSTASHGAELTPEQRDIVIHVDGPLIVTAPVGSGKTRVLVHRTIEAIERGVAPDHVLCLSFTNKAAREIRERLLTSLPPEQARQVTVCTFHALCAHIVRTDSKLLGIDSDFVIYDEDDAQFLIDRLWRRDQIEVGAKEQDKVNSLLFDFAQQAKKHSDVETSALFRRALQAYAFKSISIEPKFSPAAFLDAYRIELQSNHALDFGDLIASVARLFREHPEALRRWQQIYRWIQVDEFQDTEPCEYEIIAHLAAQHKQIAFFGDIDQTIYEWRGSDPYGILTRFRRTFAPCCELRLTRNHRSTQTLVSVCRAVLAHYERALTKKIVVVDAPRGEPVQILGARSQPNEAAWIAGKVRELQAAGVALREIAVLTRNQYTGTDLSAHLEQLGVPIYRVERERFFRRAEIKDALAYLRLLLNEYDAPSLQRVLKAPPRSFGDNPIEAILGSLTDVGLRLTDFAQLWTFIYREPFRLLLERYTQDRVVIFDVETTGLDTAQDEIVELAAIKVGIHGEVETFHHYLKPSRPVGDSERIHNHSDAFLAKRGKSASEVLPAFLAFIQGCALLGHNAAFDRAVVQAHLRQLGLPATLDALFDTLDMSRRFLQLPRYRLEDVAATLRVATPPTHRAIDDVRATHGVLRGLLPHLTAKQAERRRHVERYAPVFAPLAQQLSAWRLDVQRVRPGALLRTILAESGLRDYFEGQENGGHRLRNLEELGRLFDQGDSEHLSPTDALTQLLNSAALGNDVDRQLRDDNRVPVLTVHQAKGLEFDTVFLAGMTDYAFPSHRSVEEGREDEEHRLFYVAASRAKRRLFCSYPTKDRWGRPQLASRYLEMIPGDLKQHVSR